MKSSLYSIAPKLCNTCLLFMAVVATYAQQAAEVDTKSLILPRYPDIAAITSAITTPTQGMQVYNIATKSNWFYNGTAWTDTKSQWGTSGSHIYNANTGYVGIGTSTPVTMLDVKSLSNFVAQFSGVGPMYMSLVENNAYRGYLGSYSGAAEDVDFSTAPGNTSGKLHLATLAVPRLTVSATGDVGIGTTTPAARLHLMSAGNSSATNALSIRNSADASLINVLDNGFVGIGTNTPSARLDVKTNSNYVGQFNGASPMYMSLYEGDVYRGYIGSYSGAAEDVDFGTGSGNTNGKLHLTIQASPRLTVNEAGNVGIATIAPKAPLHVNGAMLIGATGARTAVGYALSVDGKVIAEDFTTMNSTSWPDYVFEKDYKLLPLDQLEKSIQQNKHLPNIPSAAEVEKNGIALGEMNKKLMEKIEELTLYLIELNKSVVDLNKKNAILTEEVKELKKSVPRKK